MKYRMTELVDKKLSNRQSSRFAPKLLTPRSRRGFVTRNCGSTRASWLAGGPSPRWPTGIRFSRVLRAANGSRRAQPPGGHRLCEARGERGRSIAAPASGHGNRSGGGPRDCRKTAVQWHIPAKGRVDGTPARTELTGWPPISLLSNSDLIGRSGPANGSALLPQGTDVPSHLDVP